MSRESFAIDALMRRHGPSPCARRRFSAFGLVGHCRLQNCRNNARGHGLGLCVFAQHPSRMARSRDDEVGGEERRRDGRRPRPRLRCCLRSRPNRACRAALPAFSKMKVPTPSRTSASARLTTERKLTTAPACCPSAKVEPMMAIAVRTRAEVGDEVLAALGREGEDEGVVSRPPVRRSSPRPPDRRSFP